MLTAFTIAQVLGRSSRAGRGFVCCCPAHEDRTPSLSIRDGDDGRVLWRCHAGCSQDAVRAALIARGLLDQRSENQSYNVTLKATSKPRTGNDDLWRSTRAISIWNEAEDPRDTLAEKKYLNGRGLDLDADLCGRVLRFHPRCPFGKDENGRTIYVPALIAAFRPIRSTDDDEPPQAIHRIGLNADGTKIAKMMLGPVTGCAVKLDADEDVIEGLGITEGLETGMAVRSRGWRPIWALGSAEAISALAPIPGIALTIFTDNDPPRRRPDGSVFYPGQEAARICAERWSAAGHEVTLRTRRDVGADWADLT
jgi:hypothetical protein